MSAHGIFRPPPPVNEPINSYAPGTPERDALQARLREMQNERVTIPLVIGGKDVHTDETFEAVMPHRKSHILADVSKGGPEHVQQAIDCRTRGARRVVSHALARARRRVSSRRRAPLRPVAHDAERGNDAEPVEDRAPG